MLLPVVSLLLTATPWQLSPEQVLLDVRTVGALGVGMRVALHGRRPSPLKPEETGAPRPVALGPGQRGTIVAFLQQTTTIAGLEPARRCPASELYFDRGASPKRR